MENFAWEIFLKTGSIESYLLYKELLTHMEKTKTE